MVGSRGTYDTLGWGSLGLLLNGIAGVKSVVHAELGLIDFVPEI